MESSDLSVSEVGVMRASESGPIVAGDAADALRLVEVRGSAFEMGRHAWRPVQALDTRLPRCAAGPSRSKKAPWAKAVGEKDLLRRTEPTMSYVERELPHLAEDTRGAGKSGSLGEEIHLLNIQGDLRYGLLSGCTSFAVASPDGVLIGQNFDFPPTFQDFVQLLHASPSTDRGFWPSGLPELCLTADRTARVWCSWAMGSVVRIGGQVSPLSSRTDRR